MTNDVPPPPPPTPPLPPSTMGAPPLTRSEVVDSDNESDMAPCVVPPLTQRPQASRAPTKFIFTYDTKLLLVQCVQEHEAHTAGYGKLDTAFGNVRETFIENMDAATWEKQTKPSVKTLRDKFRSLVRARRDANSANEDASGIAEDITEMDQILDDLIQEKDREEEDRKKTRDEESARDADLSQKGFEIRGEAVCRTTKETEEEKKVRKENQRRERKRRRDEGLPDDEWQKSVKEHLEERRIEARRSNEIRERELKLMQDRFDQDKREREAAFEAAREKDAKQVELMAAIINKLN